LEEPKSMASCLLCGAKMAAAICVVQKFALCSPLLSLSLAFFLSLSFSSSHLIFLILSSFFLSHLLFFLFFSLLSLSLSLSLFFVLSLYIHVALPSSLSHPLTFTPTFSLSSLSVYAIVNKQANDK